MNIFSPLKIQDGLGVKNLGCEVRNSGIKFCYFLPVCFSFLNFFYILLLYKYNGDNKSTCLRVLIYKFNGTVNTVLSTMPSTYQVLTEFF